MHHWRPFDHAPRGLVLALCSLFVACSAAAGVSDSDAHNEPEQAHARDAGSLGESASKPDVGRACEQEGARSCAGAQSREPMLCAAGMWHGQGLCNADERCESAAGPDLGRCVAIARECIGRAPDQAFCDGSMMRACVDGIPSTLQRCGERERCVAVGDRAECACAPGSVDTGNGCDAASSCAVAGGGCDPLTACSMLAGKRKCGACPAGYAGDGERGCEPVLSALAADGGELTPAFSPEVHSYHLRLPLLRQQVSLSLAGPSGTVIKVNAAQLSSGASWKSEVLSLGEHPIMLQLTAPSGLTARYEIVVERSGVQEAMIKSAQPGEHDEFGSSVALSGDTLAVSAPKTDDSAADSGTVYVFVRSGGRWEQQAILRSAEPSASELFGSSLALDGDTLLVGAPGSADASRAGRVYQFVRQGSVWTLQATIEPPDSSAGDLFGSSLALGADIAVFGAPYDADTAAHSGAVYVAARSALTATLTKLKPSEPVADSGFGWSLALDADSLLIGAPHSDSGLAYMFTRSNGSWVQRQLLRADKPEANARFGWSVALQGERAVVGAPHNASVTPGQRGQAFVFMRSGDQWTSAMQLSAAMPRSTDYFGTSVALTRDTLLIGASGDASGVGADPTGSDAPQSGAFYVYGWQDDHWVQSAYVKASKPGAGAQLAQRLAVSGDSVVAAAPYESSSGAVYVFR